MDTRTGKLRLLKDNEPPKGSEVLCPKSIKATNTMRYWGKGKREHYAKLIRVDKYTEYQAFYIVEYQGGSTVDILPQVAKDEG